MTVDLFTKPKNGFACGGTARLKSAKGESEGSIPGHQQCLSGESVGVFDVKNRFLRGFQPV